MDRLADKEKEVYKTRGDAGAVMKLYDSRQEERLVEKDIEKQDVEYLEHVEEEEDFVFSSLFDGGKKTT